MLMHISLHYYRSPAVAEQSERYVQLYRHRFCLTPTTICVAHL